MTSAAEPFLDRSDLLAKEIHAGPQVGDSGLQTTHASFEVVETLLDATETFLDATETFFELVESSFDPVESRVDLVESRVDPVESRFDPVESLFYPRQARLDRRVLGFEAVELRQERVMERLHLVPESEFRLADDSLNVGPQHLAVKRGEGAREGTDGERLVGHPRHPTPFRAAIVYKFPRVRSSEPEGESATSRDEITLGAIRVRSAPRKEGA
jgi:hypothetical protein